MSATPSNGFLATLQRHRGGKVLDEASQQLAAVVAGVLATGKPGHITVKLGVKPAGRGHSAVVVTDEVTSKAPVEKVEESFWFGTERGELCKDDPRQQDLRFTPDAPVVQGGAQQDAAPTATPKLAVNA